MTKLVLSGDMPKNLRENLHYGISIASQKGSELQEGVPVYAGNCGQSQVKEVELEMQSL